MSQVRRAKKEMQGGKGDRAMRGKMGENKPVEGQEPERQRGSVGGPCLFCVQVQGWK